MVRDIRQRSILNGNDPTVFFINNIIPFSKKIKLVKERYIEIKKVIAVKSFELFER